jgi:UDP-N-acetylglucosamine transferase subunit ALG13
MVFVVLGTQYRPFTRFLNEIENLITALAIKDEFIVQSGYTKCKSDLFQSFEFVESSKFMEYINTADIVITHAGSGAIFNAIKNNKKIIAVARLKKYGEMVDDHQTELVRKLSTEGYIIDGTYSLIEAWKKLENFIPKANDFHIIEIFKLKEYIDSLM